MPSILSGHFHRKRRHACDIIKGKQSNKLLPRDKESKRKWQRMKLIQRLIRLMLSRCHPTHAYPDIPAPPNTAPLYNSRAILSLFIARALGQRDE